MSVMYDDPCSPLFHCRAPLLPLTSAYCYMYTQDLLQLKACRSGREQVLSDHARIITTPLMVAACSWEQALHHHPDRPFCDYIMRGIREGFHVGFNGTLCSPVGTPSNMHSAEQNPAPVEAYLATELAAGRIAEVDQQYASGIIVSRFGIIPKRGQPNSGTSFLTSLIHQVTVLMTEFSLHSPHYIMSLLMMQCSVSFSSARGHCWRRSILSMLIKMCPFIRMIDPSWGCSGTVGSSWTRLCRLVSGQHPRFSRLSLMHCSGLSRPEELIGSSTRSTISYQQVPQPPPSMPTTWAA